MQGQRVVDCVGWGGGTGHVANIQPPTPNPQPAPLAPLPLRSAHGTLTPIDKAWSWHSRFCRRARARQGLRWLRQLAVANWDQSAERRVQRQRGVVCVKWGGDGGEREQPRTFVFTPPKPPTRSTHRSPLCLCALHSDRGGQGLSSGFFIVPACSGASRPALAPPACRALRGAAQP